MKMLRFFQGVKKCNNKKNVDIRQNMDVIRLGKKGKEWRLRWYGHVKGEKRHMYAKNFLICHYLLLEKEVDQKDDIWITSERIC
jgi:hypothetical protein